MDFLEGSLLGSTWCDSEFEYAHHRFACIVLTVLFWLCFSGLLHYLNHVGKVGFFLQPALWMIVFFLTFIVSPFLSFIYYDKKLSVRFCILFTQFLKYFAGYFMIYSLVIPKLIVRQDVDLKQHVMGTLNIWASKIFDRPELNNVNTLLSVMLSLLIIAIISFLLLLVVIVFFPYGYLKLLAMLQKLWDYIFLRITINQRRAYKEKHKQLMFNPMN